MNRKTFTRADSILNHWLKQLHDHDAVRDWLRLERMMLQVLPEQWQSRVVSAGIDNGVWTLCVKHGIDAYQLHFFAGEIEQRLKEKLPHPPKIKVQVNPDLWQQRSATLAPPTHLYQRRYSDAEAEAVLNALFRQHLPKPRR